MSFLNTLSTWQESAYRKGSYFDSQFYGIESIMSGKAQQQKGMAAGQVASMIKKQRNMNPVT